jgi:hypothetical protein
MRKKAALFVLCLGVGLLTSVAHSGGTDSNGGHHDRKNGGYHYHNGGRARHSYSSSSDSSSKPKKEKWDFPWGWAAFAGLAGWVWLAKKK